MNHGVVEAPEARVRVVCNSWVCLELRLSLERFVLLLNMADVDSGSYCRDVKSLELRREQAWGVVFCRQDWS